MAEKKYDVAGLLAAGRTVQFTVPTTSMYQFIRPNLDACIVAPLESPDQLRRGEVALYRRDSGMLILHRVYRHRKGQVFMLGDNQTEIEGPLREEQFLGILVAIKRGEREMPTDAPLYWLLSRLWLVMRPVRPVFWKLHDLLRRK